MQIPRQCIKFSKNVTTRENATIIVSFPTKSALYQTDRRSVRSISKTKPTTQQGLEKIHDSGIKAMNLFPVSLV